MMEEIMKDSMLEQRKTKMVSPFGGNPTERRAHFLKPVVSSMEGPALKLPSLSFSSESLNVSFKGCKLPQPKWAKWVKSMESLHHSLWKAVGIYEAITGSVCKIHTDKKLIFGIAERWCADTNTFIFPWGEATITLEDMMILGGFSVLGNPVSLPLQSPEFIKIEKNLESVHQGLIKVRGDNHKKWLDFFMNSDKFEHEAFLSLWLSRFVFPGNELSKYVFHIAINLARGTRIALAPAVLASIYRDLSVLRKTMMSTVSSSNEQCNRTSLVLCAPMFFVQVWAWERLLVLQPNQARHDCMPSRARISRWHNEKNTDVINVRNAIESAGETFRWRPYTLALKGWSIPKFYKEREQEWVICEGQELEQEYESFVRCLRVSELVGLDCVETYRPNRVAMQFGYDQDFPKWIPHSSSSPEVAWTRYSRPVDPDLTLYYPSRLFEADVTAQYLEWWRKDVLFLADALKGLTRGLRSKRRLKRLSDLPSVKMETRCDFLPDQPMNCPLKPMQNFPDAPPGFHRKYGLGEKMKLSAGSVVTTESVERRTRTATSMDYTVNENRPGVPPVFRKCGVNENMKLPNVSPESVKKQTATEETTATTSTESAHDRNESNGVAHNLVIEEQERVERSTYADMFFTDLEPRIRRLEKLKLEKLAALRKSI